MLGSLHPAGGEGMPCAAANMRTSIEEADVRPRWRASVLAAAGAATLLAGCGIRVAAEPSPSPSPPRAATTVTSAPASPEASPAADPGAALRSSFRLSCRDAGGLAVGRRAAGDAGSRSFRAARRGDRRGRTACGRGRRRPALPPRLRPARREHGRAQRRARGGRGRRRRGHGHVRAQLRAARDGAPGRGRRRHALPARRRLARLHHHHARRARRGRRARLGPAGAPCLAGVQAPGPLGDAGGDASATSPRGAAACRRTPATSCARSATGAGRCSGGCATCARPPASAASTRRRTPW